MRLLLDTHVLLWWLADDPRLAGRSAALIADPAQDVLVSAVTAWEISVKTALGKLEAPDDLVAALAGNDLASLPITVEHALRAGRLPRHHDDPFDRMLVSQAQLENLALVSADRRLDRYDVQLVRVGH